MTIDRVRVCAAAALLMAAGAAHAQQPSTQQPAKPQQHVRGDVVAVAGDVLTVKTRGGQTLALKLPENVRVAVADKADLGSIASGTFIGTTAVAQKDGTLRAVEVHVFPESMRGTGEGHRPWDLKPGSTMTNATVSSVAGSGGKGSPSSMTNATVSNVGEAGGGKKLTLKYPDGEKTVVVPPGTPVVKLEPGDRSRLKPGAHLFAIVTQQPDGTILAERLTVGNEGVVPPM
jgi:hypothetical protein